MKFKVSLMISILVLCFCFPSSIANEISYTPGSILVKYVDSDEIIELDVSEIEEMNVARVNRTTNSIEQVSSEDFIEELVDELSDDPNVEFAHPVHTRIAYDYPNDEYYDAQWHLSKVNASGAWDVTKGDSEIIIAIVDSGVDWNHPDLADNIWNNTGEDCDDDTDLDNNGYYGDCRGYDFVDIDTDDYTDFGFVLHGSEDYTLADNDPMDFNGHGTHCSGVAASVTNNSEGIASICPNCKIMPLRASFHIWCPALFCGSSGWVSILETSAVLDAIDYATDNNATIVSMSFGSVVSDTSEEYIINNSCNSGTILIASAGNSNTDTKSYPAAYTNVISVASTDDEDNKSSFSNYGSWVDIAAPGEYIVSTLFDDDYGSESGTSMSAPLVSGLVGLMKSIDSTLTQESILDILSSTGDEVLGYDFRRINAFSAVQYLITAPQIELVGLQNGSALNPGTILNFSIVDANGVSSAWYSNETDNVSMYNTSETDWYINTTDWETGEWSIGVYANDSLNNTADGSYKFYLDYAPNLTYWEWSSTINYSNSTEPEVNISARENETLQFNISAEDTDAFSNLTYNWTLDGAEINNSANMSYTFSLSSAGSHNLSLFVSDGYMDTTARWNVAVDDPFAHAWRQLLPNSSSGETAWSYDLSQYVTNNTDNDTLVYSCYPYSCDSGVVSHSFGCAGAGEYLIYANVSDGWNNLEGDFTLTVSDTAECQASPGSGGGSSGGGLPPADNLPRESRIFSSIAAGEEQTVSISNDEIPASEVSFHLDSDNTNVRLTVKKLDGRPAEVSSPSAEAYAYLEIDLEGYVGAVRDANVDFKVSKSWVHDNNINADSIYLARYSGSWQELKTAKIGETGGEYSFRAGTPGFSYFAIVGSEAEPEPAETEAEVFADAPEAPEDDGPEEMTGITSKAGFEDEGFAESGHLQILSVLLAIAILVLIYHLRSEPIKIRWQFEGEDEKKGKKGRRKQQHKS